MGDNSLKMSPFKKMTYQQFQDVKEERMEKIITMFKNMTAEDLKTTIVKQYIDKIGAPCENWSLLNQVIVYRNQTNDARTFNAWRDLGNPVKAGERSHIFVWKPISKTVKVYDPKYFGTPEQERPENNKIKWAKLDYKLTHNEKQIGTNFGLQAEFGAEQTEKPESIKYPNVPKELPPLSNVLKRLGVKFVWGRYLGKAMGSYSIGQKMVTMRTKDWLDFFHELTHAVQDHISSNSIKGGQDVDDEIIAEFTACVIANIYGIDTTKESLRYMNQYYQDKEKTIQGINKNLKMIQTILDFIFTVDSEDKVTKKGNKN
jgi:hypothetical protein